MLSILDQILCWIKQFGTLMMDAIIYVINTAIAALAALVGFVLGLLPAMPSSPSLPSEVSTVAGWIAWWIPVTTIEEIFTFVIAALIVWYVAGLLLRWVKAID